MAHNITLLLGETQVPPLDLTTVYPAQQPSLCQESLCKASEISARCAEAYDQSVDQTGASVDAAVSSMDAMLAECAKLEATFDNMDLTAARIKEIRAEVDALGYMMKRSPKLIEKKK